jgi:hypothetical protein
MWKEKTLFFFFWQKLLLLIERERDLDGEEKIASFVSDSLGLIYFW